MGVGQSRRKKKKRGARILMLGLDSAGKTTLLYRMMTESVVSTIPTVGFNVEEIFHSETKFSLNIWDIGGDANIRQLWRHYFLGSKGLIYVLDSSDHERLDLAKREFREVIMSREMSECSVVLVFANKQVNWRCIRVIILQLRMRKTLCRQRKYRQSWALIS